MPDEMMQYAVVRGRMPHMYTIFIWVTAQMNRRMGNSDQSNVFRPCAWNGLPRKHLGSCCDASDAMRWAILDALFLDLLAMTKQAAIRIPAHSVRTISSSHHTYPLHPRVGQAESTYLTCIHQTEIWTNIL